MALYNVESPGGYQLTGLTIPGVDILGSKHGYSLSRPWLFEDFDQLTFHEVSEDEYERQLAMFHSGRYEYEWEAVTFDMAEHNDLLRRTEGEVEAMRKRQKKAQGEMGLVEKDLMERWIKEKEEGKVPMDTVEALLHGMYPHFPSKPEMISPMGAKVVDARSKSPPFYRPSNLPNRKPPQRQRVENPRPRRRSAQRERRGCRPRGNEVGDFGPGGRGTCGVGGREAACETE